MKVLIIGSGAREHAIASKILENKSVEKIYVAKGNAGTKITAKCENVDIEKIKEIVEFVKKNAVDLTISGSEALLVEGIVDVFKEENLCIFGADKKAAMLEGSKAYSKSFMEKYGVKTAEYKTFRKFDDAKEYIKTQEHPIVVKASGLALGKGVIICQNENETLAALKEIMLDKVFGSAGDEVVIEEYLDGFEASILSITDSGVIIPFISAKDHKKIGDNDTGLNTGGMGSIAPNPHFTEKHNEAFIKDILEPTLKGIKAEGMSFSGFIFFGLMITKKGVYLLEYNMRLGDPETQVVLPMMETDFLSLLTNTLSGKLSETKIKWKDGFALCVVASAIGYPDKYEIGKEIKGLDKIASKIFMAGVREDGGKFLTAGGRALTVVDFDKTLLGAREKVYKSLENIDRNVLYFRKDIGDIK